jgi:hypothetical protein
LEGIRPGKEIVEQDYRLGDSVAAIDVLSARWSEESRLLLGSSRSPPAEPATWRLDGKAFATVRCAQASATSDDSHDLARQEVLWTHRGDAGHRSQEGDGDGGC